MVEGLETSPLKEAKMQEIRNQCREIVEEPTSRGFRVKLRID